jgi:hypothetical protein
VTDLEVGGGGGSAAGTRRRQKNILNENENNCMSSADFKIWNKIKEN